MLWTTTDIFVDMQRMGLFFMAHN